MVARKAVRAHVKTDPSPRAGEVGVDLDPEHEAALETLLSTFRTAVALEMRCDLADAPTGEPHNRETFRAHFASADVELERWNAVVEHAHAASHALWRRLAHSASDHGISEPPFMVGALIDHLATRTLERSRRWELGTAQKALLQHFNDRIDGSRHVSVYLLGRRVAILPGGPEPAVKRRVEAADALINELLDDARRCIEAQRVADTRDSLLELKQRLLDDRRRQETIASIAFAPSCSRCQSLLAA
jgi:hypothetical protein